MGIDITGLGAISELVTTAINKVWPDKTETEKAQLAAAVGLVTGQLEINKEEAKSGSVFVSGARPFIMWMCGVALGYAAIIDPILRFVATVGFSYTGSYPVIDTAITLQVLLGLLGLGGLRTVDKYNGTASK